MKTSTLETAIPVKSKKTVVKLTFINQTMSFKQSVERVIPIEFEDGYVIAVEVSDGYSNELEQNAQLINLVIGVR